jgi:hypothetical protein
MSMARIPVGKLAVAGAAAAIGLSVGGGGAAAGMYHHTVLAAHPNQSGNWSGYNVGTLDYGNDTRFTSITGEWKVPAVSMHNKKDGTEYSSNWIGIGGGCVNASCSVTDSTLIQTGTEQDASTSGSSYSAWWEIIPLTSQTISNFTVGPGDLVYASIGQSEPEVWVIALKDLTRHESFSTTVPYSSSELTAEWISETPVVVGSSSAAIATMPNVKGDSFDLGTVNGTPVALNSADEMQLVSNGTVEATPSAPDSDHDGFNDCSYATSCARPSSS